MPTIDLAVVSRNKDIVLKRSVKFELRFDDDNRHFIIYCNHLGETVFRARSKRFSREPIDFIRELILRETRRGQGTEFLNAVVQLDIGDSTMNGIEWIEELLSDYATGEIVVELDDKDETKHRFEIDLDLIGKTFKFRFKNMRFSEFPEINWQKGECHIFERTPAT